jgi:hypothetical protein
MEMELRCVYHGSNVGEKSKGVKGEEGKKGEERQEDAPFIFSL